MNMIEKVARAIFDIFCPGIRYTDEDKKYYTEVAKAAIKTMRKPTPEIKQLLWGVVSERYWQSLIDAALKED